MFKESNLRDFANSVIEFVKPFMTKPVSVIVMVAIFLCSTTFIGTIMASPFGIGVLLGILATLYIIANYSEKKHKN